MPVCIRLLALQALVAPIYWCCEHHSTNILVLPAHVAPIYWCYDVRSTTILVLRCSQHQYIGATSACSANRRIHTGILQLKNFRGFFICLQHQYIGANRFAAPIYWRCTRRTQLFAAPRLIVETMPIQSAVVSGKGNRIISRWRPN